MDIATVFTINGRPATLAQTQEAIAAALRSDDGGTCSPNLKVSQDERAGTDLE